MEVIGGDQAGNLERARIMISEAATNKIDLILLPEVMDFGWTHPSVSVYSKGEKIISTIKVMAEIAYLHKIHICFGYGERVNEKIYNSAVLLNPDGHIILKHRKINELEVALDLYHRGNKIEVAEIPGIGKVGLMICADAFAEGEVLSRSLALMGADFILSPCAWAVDKTHDNKTDPYGDLWKTVYGRVAREFGICIFGCSNTGDIDRGPWSHRKCIGNSLAVGPSGSVIASGGYDLEEIVYVEFNSKTTSN